MKRKYIYTIVVAVFLVCLALSAVFLRPDKEEQLVKEFLDQTFTKSEENAELYQEVMDSPSVIGLDVDQQTQKETVEKGQQASEEFEKAYSTYLDSNGMNDFQNGLFGYMLDLYTADETWEISETEITEDNDVYKFRVIINVGDNLQEIQGRAEVIDGKIGNLDITEL
nr:hypothetical protein [uncultured Sellimonas sp.]